MNLHVAGITSRILELTSRKISVFMVQTPSMARDATPATRKQVVVAWWVGSWFARLFSFLCLIKEKEKLEKETRQKRTKGERRVKRQQDCNVSYVVSFFSDCDR
jgi:hypothetical protein